MLIEEGWKPGVWVDGVESRDINDCDAFGSFAHHVHEDLLAARAAGRIPKHVKTTISASTIRPLWGDEPPVWLLHIRFTGFADVQSAALRNEVAAEALASLERHSREHLPSDGFERYAGTLFFVDDHGQLRHSWTHDLRPRSDGAAVT
ncbi:hypothetical protein ACWED2_09975 [Amycolatopsis sp. NPDC005003]